MHWSEWSTSTSPVIFPQHNHHQSQLQYTQDTCKALSSPRNLPSITYMALLWTTFLLITLSIMLPLYTPSLSFTSYPPPPHSYCQCFCLIPLTVYLIQSKLLHSSQTLITISDNLVVCLSITPPFPTTVCWGCTTPLHDRLPFYSLFENPFLVTYLHPLLSLPGIFPLQLNVHFVIHST